MFYPIFNNKELLDWKSSKMQKKKKIYSDQQVLVKVKT